jgi:hypothetical protein
MNDSPNKTFAWKRGAESSITLQGGFNMKSLTAKSLLLGFALLLILTVFAIAPSYSAENKSAQNTFILSDEAPGNLISLLVKTEYGGYNLYQVLLQIQADANPSAAGIITPSFLSALASCPAGSQIFTAKLNDFPAGSSLAISTDGTVQTVKVHADDYFGKAGASEMLCSIAGAGDVYLVHSGTQLSTADFNMPLKSWTVGGTTYNVVAIASNSVNISPVTKNPAGKPLKGGMRTTGSPFDF